MKKKANYWAIIIILLSTFIMMVSGCTTTMSSKHSIHNEKGIRYYLPAPHLLVTPKSDGTATFEIIYLPDPNNSYTLNLESHFSSATFDIQLADGMLKSLNLNAEAQNIPDETLKTANALKLKQIENKDAEKKAEKTAKEERVKAAQKAEEELRSKENELFLAEAKLEFYKKQPQGTFSDDQLRDAEWKIEELRIQKEFLEKVKENFSDVNALNVPKPELDSSLKNAFGPVLFRILPTDNGGVKLVAVEEQKGFQTSITFIEATFREKLNFDPKFVNIKKDDKKTDFVLKFNKPIGEIFITETKLMKAGEGATAQPILSGNQIDAKLVSEDKKSIKIVIPKETESGNYRLQLVIKTSESDVRIMVPIFIQWMLE